MKYKQVIRKEYITSTGYKIEIVLNMTAPTSFIYFKNNRYFKTPTRVIDSELYLEGMLIKKAKVKQDSRDKDDVSFAIRLSVKKLIEHVNKGERIMIWKDLLNDYPAK